MTQLKTKAPERPLPYVNFNQLRSFHAVARELNFTRAARVLNIGQSTLTVQVRNLEERYGVELFLRSSRGLQLSCTGQTLYEITIPLFDLEEQAVNLLRANGDAIEGTLRVGTVGPFFVMKLVGEFQARYPNMQVNIDSGNSDTVLRQIIDARTDVAITGCHIDDPRVYSSKLRAHEILVLVNRHHALAGTGSIPLAALQGQPMIMRERGSMTRKAFEAALVEHGVRPRVVMEVSRDTVHEAVIEGLGVGVVSEPEFQPHVDLCALRIDDYPSFTYSYVICLESRRQSKPISRFTELAEAISQDPA
jgi:aminoethylphosphonate catabolism LysR family transcriptional regulator